MSRRIVLFHRLNYVSTNYAFSIIFVVHSMNKKLYFLLRTAIINLNKTQKMLLRCLIKIKAFNFVTRDVLLNKIKSISTRINKLYWYSYVCTLPNPGLFLADLSYRISWKQKQSENTFWKLKFWKILTKFELILS